MLLSQFNISIIPTLPNFILTIQYFIVLLYSYLTLHPFEKHQILELTNDICTCLQIQFIGTLNALICSWFIGVLLELEHWRQVPTNYKVYYYIEVILASISLNLQKAKVV